MRRVLLALALALAAATPAAGQEFTPDVFGVAVPLDGDTLILSGDRTVRLFGIDAPEMSQWPLGARARGALDHLVYGRRVECQQAGADRHGRILARCKTEAQAGGVDLAQAMLKGGWAVVYRRYTCVPQAVEGAPCPGVAGDYDAAEREARLAQRGLWSR